MSHRMRVVLCKKIGALRFRRYLHERGGVVETLTQETVVYVRPVFGFLKPESGRAQSLPARSSASGTAR